jgi:hypothetical protein
MDEEGTETGRSEALPPIVPRMVSVFKTAVFKLHNPSQHKRAMLRDAMKLLPEVPEGAGLPSVDFIRLPLIEGKSVMRLIAHSILLTGTALYLAQPVTAEALEFQCRYKKGGDPKGEDFSLKFTLDTVTKEAFMIGNVGLSKVIAVGGEYGLSFLEYLPTGAVQTTTITKGGNSVHSRNSMMGERLMPSQFLGFCDIK